MSISKTLQGNDLYYVLNIEDPEAIVELEDQSGVSDPVTFEFPTPCAELQLDEQHSSIEKTNFLALLDIVGKLTDDIRGLQVRIDEYSSRNERLLLENCELKLDIAWLQSKLKTQSEPMSPNQLPSAKVHPAESTSLEDELLTAQLKKELLGLREKILHLEKSKAMDNSFVVSPGKKNSDEMNAIEIAA